MTRRRICSALAALGASLALSGCPWFGCDEGERVALVGGVHRCVPDLGGGEPQAQPVVVWVEAYPPVVLTGNPVTFYALVRTSGDAGRDAELVSFEWDLDANGSFETDTGQIRRVSHTYSQETTLRIRVVATDAAGNRYTGSGDVVVIGRHDSGPNERPSASFTVRPNPARVGQVVHFDGSGSSDAEGPITRYEWDLDGNGSFETDTRSTPTTETEYGDVGDRDVWLRVTDDEGAQDQDNQLVRVIPPGEGNPRGLPPPASAAALAPARRFSARLKGVPLAGHRGRVRRTRGTVSRRHAVAVGDFRGNLKRADPAMRSLLQPFLRAYWLTELDFSTSRKSGTTTVRGLALTTSKGFPAAQSCLRIRLVFRKGRKPAGSLRVLGGSGSGENLDARARFTLRFDRKGRTRLTGTIRAGSRAARPVPASCRALESIRPSG